MMLEDLIERLSSEDPRLVLTYGLVEPHSYRGYYDCLAFEPKANVTIGDCLAAAQAAVGSVYTGYKGGDYYMGMNTDCYIAEWGCTGDELTASWLDLNIELAKIKATQEKTR